MQPLPTECYTLRAWIIAHAFSHALSGVFPDWSDIIVQHSLNHYCFVSVKACLLTSIISDCIMHWTLYTELEEILQDFDLVAKVERYYDAENILLL